MPAGPGGTERGSYVLDAGRGTGGQSLIWSSPDYRLLRGAIALTAFDLVSVLCLVLL
jgi:hypothetical protein